MSLQSCPLPAPRRKYGAVQPHGDDGVDILKEQFATVRDNLRRGEGGAEREPSGGRQWANVAVVGILAVFVIAGLELTGSRLPTTASAPPQQVEAPSGGDATTGLIEASTPLIIPGARDSDGDRGSIRVGAGGSGEEEDFWDSGSPDLDVEPGSLAPLAFTALNFYHVRDGKPALDYPWLKEVKLIEPHRDTTFAVVSPRPGFAYRWTVRGGDPEESELRADADGSEVVLILKELDDNTITLEEVERATGTVARRLVETVMVKYVRREIRTLTNDERKELFDAMYTLWSVRVDDGNGKELYGEDYGDVYAINRLHYKAASPVDCDHFHDGLGFLTAHSLISNIFEASLQTVNPKLTLPYWDFTIEGSAEGASNSTLFSEEWFGTYNADDNMVKDGRWAYIPIPRRSPKDAGNLTPDIYGRLRAPWNVNHRAYLTRGMGDMCGFDLSASYPWPTCEVHYELVTEYDDFYSFVWRSLYDPHGPVHIWIGGVLDCEDAFGRISSLVGVEAGEQLAMLSFVYRKNLYREKIFFCEGPVDITETTDELFGSGQCGCLGYDLSQGDDYINVYDRLAFIDTIIGDAPDDIKRQVVELICSSPTTDGDQLQASSSLDPSFWSTHPTMERLWMYAVLTGQVTDFTWPDSDITVTKPDGTVVQESVSIYGETCSGHGGSDVFPFGLLATDVDGFNFKTGIRGNVEYGNVLTNREALAAFDPRSNSLPYVYDTFKWTHCEAEGVFFDDAWKFDKMKLKSRKSRPSFEEGEPRLPRYSSINAMKAREIARKATAHGQA